MQFKSMVISNVEISSGYFRMRLTAPREMLSSKPGQFVMVKVRDAIDPLLRRPFGIFDLGSAPPEFSGGVEQPYLEILYRVVGKGTAMLAALHHSDHLDILAPLGKGFEIPVVSRVEHAAQDVLLTRWRGARRRPPGTWRGRPARRGRTPSTTPGS